MSKNIIKITEAMLAAVASEGNFERGLAGVIEIIERNYVVQPRCPERLGDDMRCSLPAGHDGTEHPVILPNGTRITFQNLVDNSTGIE
jgi:hypothetical protein